MPQSKKINLMRTDRNFDIMKVHTSSYVRINIFSLQLILLVVGIEPVAENRVNTTSANGLVDRSII